MHFNVGPLWWHVLPEVRQAGVSFRRKRSRASPERDAITEEAETQFHGKGTVGTERVNRFSTDVSLQDGEQSASVESLWIVTKTKCEQHDAIVVSTQQRISTLSK
eukprot:TRINITY_DN52858_c0_g1_i1.p1 TRINITY_DN52858_c0_g1~~TRINITY_DN52858_c0_g1_i1.p1  ORF type:complete len:105 (-),score=14.46 TRINITY_DN52858_c0_g1_i1:78-392(-)